MRSHSLRFTTGEPLGEAADSARAGARRLAADEYSGVADDTTEHDG